mmetsp:Transcript_7789/g.12599  ORF Transcript_7789/g.12599 Transcript_7789/m.12599 type:complete len:219 (-) Transcript_7789:1693-2349(-)
METRKRSRGGSSSKGEDGGDLLERFTKTAAMGVPVSSLMSIERLADQGLDGICVVFEGLVGLAYDICSQGSNRDDMLRALLDCVEFMVLTKEQICTRDRLKLTSIREVAVRFENTVNEFKDKIDYRALSIFMEDKIGNKALNKNGPICSEFNKIKARLFRGSQMTWEEREKLITQLLKNVSDKRHGFLVEGRAEIRGYQDMSDQELKAWSTLAGELLD